MGRLPKTETTNRSDEKLRTRLMQLGARIAYIRKIRGLTQEQLAEKSGYSVSYLAKIEANTGECPNLPSLDFLYHVADVLNVPIGKLFEADII